MGKKRPQEVQLLTPEQQLQWYEAFFQKAKDLRSAYYDRKRFITGADERMHRNGLLLDHMIREQIKRNELQKYTEDENSTNSSKQKVYQEELFNNEQEQNG